MNSQEVVILKEQLIRFKILTAHLIELLEKNDFDSIENIFQLRQNVIDIIETISFKQSDFKIICEEIGILPVQKKLILLMNEKKTNLKCAINNLKNSKMANINYNKGYSIDSLYFNKKI